MPGRICNGRATGRSPDQAPRPGSGSRPIVAAAARRRTIAPVHTAIAPVWAIAILAALGIATWVHLAFWRRRLALHGCSEEVLRPRTSDGWVLALARRRPGGPPLPTPVLLVHGIAMNGRAFDFGGPPRSFAAALAAAGLDAFVLDLRGHGDARADPGAPRHWSLDDYLTLDVPAALDAVREATGAARVLWVGHSQGALLGLAAASLYPARIAGVVALAPPIRFDAAGPTVRTLRALPVLARLRLARRLSRLAAPFAGLWQPAAAGIAVRLAEMERPVYQRMLMNVIEDLPVGVVAQFTDFVRRDRFGSRDGTADYLAALSTCRQPALFVAAPEDGFAPPAVVEEACARWGGEKAYLEAPAGVGHADLILGRRAPAWTFPAVRDWLVRHAAVAAPLLGLGTAASAGFALLALLALVAPGPALAGEPAACVAGEVLLLDGLGTPEEELADLAELTGGAPPSLGVLRDGAVRARPLCRDAIPLGWTARAAKAAAPAGGGFEWLALPLRLATTWNSTYPSGGNDGLLWAGRGVSSLATGGVAVRAGPLSAALAPEVAWQQNRWFRTTPTGLPGDAQFSSPWYGAGLDQPQRFGAGPFSSAGLGQSFVRLDAGGVALGLSTANRWWGPGFRNALLLTNEAQGFPHAFLGTSRPVDVWLGRLEALAFWGRLDRSRYAVGPSGHPWITGLALGFEPRWVPGLTVGAGRVFVESLQSLQDDAYLTVLEGVLKSQVRGGDNPRDNQVASLWFRWAMPEAGFELHGEWGRDDFPISVAGLLREPDRTSGYVAGFQKLFRLGGPRAVRVQAEVARLYEARPLDAFGGLPVWYTHLEDLGYSHRGQLLGASVGPGGASQFLAVDLFTASGRLGGWIERTARNEEAYWAVARPADPTVEHDAELTVGFRQVLFAGPVEVAWHLAGAFRWARDFRWNEPNLQAGVQLAVPLGPAPGTPRERVAASTEPRHHGTYSPLVER